MYIYGSKLETASPRFSQPGDFFTYVLFVAATIIVGFDFRSCQVIPLFAPSHLHTARVVYLFTIAVLKDEEDYPCTSAGSVIRKKLKGLVRGVGMVGSSYEKTRVIHQLGSGGCGSLHFLKNTVLCLTEDYRRI